ncbi:MAG TPA: DUF433 domain-containing protein [Dehalococcoidia bacterium]|nr:DUF433 domain-containing protein [Dehalococcoidia bacterium]
MVAEEQPADVTRIVRDPRVLSGKPVVRGTRIPVELVLSYLARHPDFSDLFTDYPRLTMDDVKACLAFAQSMVERGAGAPAQDAGANAEE